MKICILLFWMSCLVVSGQDVDSASSIKPASLPLPTVDPVDATQIVPVPEPSISLLVAAGGFFYLLRWRTGRRR